MESISQEIRAERMKLAQTGGFFWLLELSPSPARVYRLTNNNEAITFPTGGATYDPAPFRVAEHRQSGDGSLPSMSLDFDNADRSLTALLREHNGFTDQTVTLKKVHSDHLDSEDHATTHTFLIKDVADGAGVVHVGLGEQDLMDCPIPARTYDPRCAWAYRRDGCSYAGALATCDHTLTGDNGCMAHFGTDATLPFGGFPGIVE